MSSYVLHGDMDEERRTEHLKIWYGTDLFRVPDEKDWTPLDRKIHQIIDEDVEAHRLKSHAEPQSDREDEDREIGG
ncbi:hypothetical protein [Actinomycetospora soli]|uniref:hypothetical protein n=1 Tax=Actinomycetospora soli TaxID=2893887 RepID=UPI001E4D3E4D|nr:hypothetical protein [Actinomycetospora soli]MCD2191350.1 hypothetical protein [Actinomycetospora soli]